MEKRDTRRLFSLIETIYPNAKQQSRTAADLEAWTLVLAPWDYEDVKQAVIVRARETGFTRMCMNWSHSSQNWKTQREGGPHAGAVRRLSGKFYAKAGEQHERWHEAGIPTPSEAKKQGMTYAAWCALADMRGV